MVVERLDDLEFGRHVRLQNRLRSQRQRERLATSGQVAFTCWIPSTLRDRILTLARDRGIRINDVVAEALFAGLPPVNVPAPATTFQEPPPSNPDRNATIIELHSQGLTLSQISNRLAELGYLTRNGTKISDATILLAVKRHEEKSR